MKEELPSDWKRERLEKLCLKTSQKDPRKDPETPFIYVDVSSISTQSFSIVEAKSLIGKNAPSRARKLIRKDDIIFATVRPTLKRVAIISDEFDNQICSTGYCVLRPNKMHLFPPFLYFQLLTENTTNRVAALQKGATYPAISDSDLFSQLILLPPLPEQRAIARALRAVQAARETRLREIALERERKAALMEHLFTHGTRGEPTKRTEIGEMPESWEVVKFGKVIISSAFGPRFSSNYYDPDGSVATLRTTDLDNEGNINYSTMPLAKLELDGFKQHLLKSNDFLITRSGTCGIAAIFEAFEKPVLPGAFIIRFRLSNEINPLFLKYYVNSQQGRNRILQLAGGAVQKNLSGTSLRTFQIPLPLLVDQDAIVRSLIACDSKIAALDHEAHLHDKLFRAMLEELMTGRLRVGALATPSS